MSSAGCKRQAEQSPDELRAQLAREATRDLQGHLSAEVASIKFRRRRLVNRDFSVYAGTSLMTVRYSDEAQILEVVPVDELGSAIAPGQLKEVRFVHLAATSDNCLLTPF